MEFLLQFGDSLLMRLNRPAAEALELGSLRISMRALEM